MDKDKNQLEIKISKTAIDIFSLKKSDDFDESEYKALFTKLSDLIWRWAKITFGQKVENASIEIMECIKRSLSSFKEGENEYVKYISASLKIEIEKANRKNQLSERELIRIPEKKRIRINQIFKYAEGYGKSLESNSDLKKIASVFNLSDFDLKELLQWKHQAGVLQDCVISNDGNEISLIESQISSQSFLFNPEAVFLNKEINKNIENRINDFLSFVDEVFVQEKEKTENQKKSKQYVGALITRQIIEELSKIPSINQTKICRMLDKKRFTDQTVLELFKQEKLISQQEIAAWYNKDKTDASRKVNTFLQKLQENLSTIEKVDSSV